jgi:hypothetical protein
MRRPTKVTMLRGSAPLPTCVDGRAGLHRDRRGRQQLEHRLGQLLDHALELAAQVLLDLGAQRLVLVTLVVDLVELEHAQHRVARGGDVADGIERLAEPVVHIRVLGVGGDGGLEQRANGLLVAPGVHQHEAVGAQIHRVLLAPVADAIEHLQRLIGVVVGEADLRQEQAGLVLGVLPARRSRRSTVRAAASASSRSWSWSSRHSAQSRYTFGSSEPASAACIR